jgi:geranylgeranyl pyrophosphate synthase
MASYDTAIESKDWTRAVDGVSLDEFRQHGATRIEEVFRRSLLIPAETEPGLSGALNHLLWHAGSMVRPRLVIQVASAYGMRPDAAINLAIALEYFHTASLVFDDLPCMDNATVRRGAACVHVPFGEASAILAALALINRAYALTWKALAGCSPDIRERATEYLEQRLGVAGLLNGQSLDLNYARLLHDRETTERIACGKTVSLIRLTLVLPAMLGGATRREVRLLERMAMCWGLGYQMVDDLKDVLQSSAQSGKTAARDLHLDRPNIALAIGVPAAVARLIRLIRLGDRMLIRLLALRPSLGFLTKLRSDLQAELIRVTDNACELTGSLET